LDGIERDIFTGEEEVGRWGGEGEGERRREKGERRREKI
jgi:hypothetical protein